MKKTLHGLESLCSTYTICRTAEILLERMWRKIVARFVTVGFGSLMNISRSIRFYFWYLETCFPPARYRVRFHVPRRADGRPRKSIPLPR